MFAAKDRFLTNAVAGGGYAINNSLRFRASASAYLNRTCGVPTSSQKWTSSNWVKRGSLGAATMLYAQITNSNNSELIQFNSSDQLEIWSFTFTSPGNTYYVRLVSTQVFRDPSAWYHIVVNTDTTQATASNRVRAYVNGVEITSWSTATYPTQNYNWKNINTSTIVNYYGVYALSAQYFDGYLAEWNFVDGQQLTPSSFGSFDANGVWSPTAYSGTYGNNGFYLKFADNSGATATTIGKDSSGNGNNWTPNNISVTAGTTYDSMIDSPTNAASATQPVGNYCVISPLDENFTTSTAVVSDGNLKFALSSTPANQQVCRGTMGGVSKFYFEVVTLSVGAGLAFGVKTTGAQLTSSGGLQASASWEILCTNGNKWNGSSVAYGSAYTTNDVGMCAVDPVNGKIWFGKNGTWFASGDPAAGTNAAFTNVVSSVQPLFECGVSTDSIAANFGQRPFTYTPPSGYQALCTANLATPTIKNGAQYMAATTYTGTGATLSITNTVNSTSFKPDWVWTKSRSASTDNKITDSVRGVTNALITNSTAAQTTDAGGVTAFNSNGFTLGTTAAYNTNTATYIGWQWLCNAGTTSSNTNGSITSTVQVNATAGFSILTYTGTGANATVGHGLGVTPSMIIVKAYSGATGPFSVWHTKLPIPTTQRFGLNNATTISASATYWNSTLPTSSVFSIGTSTDVNTSTASYLAYCFAAITGYSAFGSYVGNASTDGPFVYCGFRPRCILIRLTDTTTGENSYLFDTSRNTYNTVQNALEPSQNFSESVIGVVDYIDILSNGFKCRSATLVNASGLTYVYAAFAENPFNYSRAR